MHVTLYTKPTAFDLLAGEWQNLMGRAVTAPIFMTPEYQKTWWEHLGVGDLNILAVREPESQQLIGLAPLLIDNGEIRFVGCVDVSDYLDFLIDADYQPQVYQAIVDYLATELAPEWQSAYFCSLAFEHSPTPNALLELTQGKGWSVQSEKEEVCPVITLAESWETYLAGIDKKQRHEIRRKLRRAEAAADVRWYAINSTETLTDEAISTFIELHRKSAPDKDEFWTLPMLDFFRALTWKMAEAGWLKLYFVEIDGVAASALLCFDYNNEILVYNSGFDMDQFAALSPGNIIVSYSIQHAIELGRARYDFLRGDEIYKFRFGAIAEDVTNIKINKETADG